MTILPLISREIPLQREAVCGRVVLLQTGGTAASATDAASGARDVTPELPGYIADVAGQVREMWPGVELDVRLAPFRRDSSRFKEETVCEGVGAVRRLLEEQPLAVIVQTGTDLMSRFAPALAFGLGRTPGAPVVLTGSMRSANDLASDAPSNLAFAIEAALASHAAAVTVAFAGRILPSCNLLKVSNDALDPFTVRMFPAGPLPEKLQQVREQLEFSGWTLRAFMDLHQLPGPPVVDPALRFAHHVRRLRFGVVSLRVSPSLGIEDFEQAIETGADFILLHAYANGTAHDEVVAGVQYAVRHGVEVLVTSQCPYGRVDMSQYGASKALADAGALALTATSADTAEAFCWMAGSILKDSRRTAMLLASARDTLPDFLLNHAPRPLASEPRFAIG